mmetsp:Transcript_100520/g.199664  ORF Transcript_100520/g.199664 Transcript_100520/m.199664 type:complete len:144 (-) Transcript_100520:64-495(-)
MPRRPVPSPQERRSSCRSTSASSGSGPKLPSTLLCACPLSILRLADESPKRAQLSPRTALQCSGSRNFMRERVVLRWPRNQCGVPDPDYAAAAASLLRMLRTILMLRSSGSDQLGVLPLNDALGDSEPIFLAGCKFAQVMNFR